MQPRGVADRPRQPREQPGQRECHRPAREAQREPDGRRQGAAEPNRPGEHRTRRDDAGGDGPAQAMLRSGADGEPYREDGGEFEKAFAHELARVKPARGPHEAESERDPCRPWSDPPVRKVADERRGDAVERALDGHRGGDAAEPQLEREERAVARGAERVELEPVEQRLLVDEPVAGQERARDRLERLAVHVEVGVRAEEQVHDGPDRGRDRGHPAEHETRHHALRRRDGGHARGRGARPEPDIEVGVRAKLSD